MSFLYTNNATSTLAAGITAVELSITLQSGDGALFPNPSGGDTFQATIVDAGNNIEIIQCTARVGDVLTVLRGQEGTIANAYLSGDSIGLRLTAGGISNFAQVIDAVMKALPAIKTAGDLTFSDNVKVMFGDAEDAELYSTGGVINFDVNGGVQFIIRDGNTGNTNRFTFDIDTGDLTITGKLTADEGIDGFTGMIAPFPTAVVPTGWLECAGQAVNRTTYATLYAITGDLYGDGNGSTTFNLPDFRGRFLRGWDHGAGTDPDAAGRTDAGDGVTGDNVGTKQADEFKSHTHNVFTRIDPVGDSEGGNGDQRIQSFTSATSGAGGNETRPKNINVMYCIKF